MERFYFEKKKKKRYLSFSFFLDKRIEPFPGKKNIICNDIPYFLNTAYHIRPNYSTASLNTHLRNSSTRSCKKFCHWVRITSVLRFVKHIFITNLQSIPPLLKHIFVTFLPSREKQINSLLLVSVGDTDNSAAKRTSRRILISRKHFLRP